MTLGKVSYDGLPPGTLVPKRALGPIQATITVEEHSTDELVITEHPVEQNAAITDHAYKKPAKLMLRLAWSQSDLAAGTDQQYLQNVYAQILKLQSDRIPVDIFTGKRSYSNMLLQSVAQVTDQKTETSLYLLVSCQQVILVNTVAVPVPTNPQILATPEETLPVQDAGTVQPAAASPPDSLQIP